MKMLIVAGARPNFMKIAPLIRAIDDHNKAVPNGSRGIEYVLVHTGQHYDIKMSEVFFNDLGLPRPHVNLEVGSASHAVQTANIMIKFEQVCLDEKPDWVIVVGDVNSTMACTLVATKLGIRVGHVEAGLRSNDRTMPEEINRIVTDSLADLLFTPSEDADDNLLGEGVAPGRIKLVGNIMIDSLEMVRKTIELQSTHRDLGLASGGYGVVTMHRPSNVDEPAALKEACGVLAEVAKLMPLVFPVHPRTRRKLEENRLLSAMESAGNMLLLEPLNYISFMNLVFHCRLVITDSGGIQEETTYLGIPCLTVRENTERPITVTRGTNRLCAWNELKRKTVDIVRGHVPMRQEIELWDGKTAGRIVEILLDAGTASTW